MSYQTVFIFGGIVLDVDFDYAAGRPAVINAPAEDCYPAEDANVNINSVSCGDERMEIDDIGLFIDGEYTCLDTVIEDYICENASELIGE